MFFNRLQIKLKRGNLKIETIRKQSLKILCNIRFCVGKESLLATTFWKSKFIF